MRCNHCSELEKIKYESPFGDRLCEACAGDLIYEPALGGYIHLEDSKEFYMDDDISDIIIYQEV
jgi:hypothetical protein